MILSILIPSIPERIDRLSTLVSKIEKQIGELPIEVIVLMDNKKISIGEKRERLKNMAQGKYFCFVDDDDDVSIDYIEELYTNCLHNVDVVCFDTLAKIENQYGFISVSIHNENEQFKQMGTTKRKPSHVNAWLTEKFKQFSFSDKNYGEDFDFCNQCYQIVESSIEIHKVLHFYTYDKAITMAFD